MSREVQTLRSQLLRLLAPPSTRILPTYAIQMKQNVAEASQEVYAQTTSYFLRGCRKFLQYPVSKSAQERLKRIFQSAGELSLLLWTQRSYVSILGLKELPETFSSSNQYLSAHTLHARELDEDEACLDGLKILFVLHPAVVAVGDSEGADYGTVRILKKAVVWMGSPDHGNRPNRVSGTSAAVAAMELD